MQIQEQYSPINNIKQKEKDNKNNEKLQKKEKQNFNRIKPVSKKLEEKDIGFSKKKHKTIKLKQRKQIETKPVKMQDESEDLNSTLDTTRDSDTFKSKDKPKLQELVGWKTSEVMIAAALFFVVILPCVLYVIYKNNEIDKKNKEIKNNNEKILSLYNNKQQINVN